MLNAAFKHYYDDYEIIEGEKVMSPAANLSHNKIITRIYSAIENYCVENKIEAHIFTDSIDVHLPDGNYFKPDLTVVTKENAKILDWQGDINGVPDMVVEVLSKSTRTKDLTIKKSIYERNGVKVYWIVDPWSKIISVYLLEDGRYFFEDEYIYFDEKEFNRLGDDEKAEVQFEVPVHLFEGCNISLAYIFKWCPW